MTKAKAKYRPVEASHRQLAIGNAGVTPGLQFL
jgi:hypothetical protein